MEKKSGKILPLLLVLIIFLLVAYIFRDKYLNKDEEKSIKDNNESKILENNEKEEDESFVKENVELYSYKKTIMIEDSEEEENFEVNKNVYLFKDGRYYYNYVEYGDTCGVWSIGTYNINNNTLILKEEKHGECEGCYYTKNLKNYNFDINNNTLVSSDNEVLEKTISEIIPELNVEEMEEVKNCDESVE